MRQTLFILTLLSCQVFGQAPKSLHPTLGNLVDRSPEGEAEYKKPDLIDLDYYDIIALPFDDFKTSSSSELEEDTISYSAYNVTDLSYKTAWIEGVKGYGIGEFLILELPSDLPIGSLVFIGGFAKSKKIWTDYSRPKTLEMFVNDKPIALLNLADTRREQDFKFNVNEWSELKPLRWTIKFKIVDVYKGDKYDKTAITEIHFGSLNIK
jgi:hypothetical protein